MVSTASSLLDGLDEQQRVAAEALIGPVCMLAGAGTGKTRAITHRIAHGVATGVYTPSRVMALTFTTRAAAELRGRLRSLGAGGVAARTFHSAALSQLNYFWPIVVGGNVPRLVESKGRVLGHVAERLKLRLDTATLRDLASEIEWRKISALSIEEYGARMAGRKLPERLSADAMLAVHQGYEDLKDERKQLDFEDVLLATAGMIENEPSMAMQVREQYRFFVVDEFQDVSPLQNTLLNLWLGDRRDLCVVGDASQTVYSFAGARADYLLDFPYRFDNTTVVRLEQNYRSTPAIVATANRLMRGRPGALTLHARAADAEAAVSEPAEPDITEYPTDIAEARGIAQRIHQLIERGARPETIAVLYRVNVQSAAIETALAELGIQTLITGSRRFFELGEVKQAVMALRAASVSIMGEPLFKSVSDVLRGLGWSQSPPEARGAVRDRWESLNAIMGLVDQAPAGQSFREFTDDLLARAAAQHEPTMAAVNLATLHSAKGLEWEHVFLIGLSEGLMPISYAAGFDAVDEERRLLYVGITRARASLHLSWSAQGSSQRSLRERSRFLAEIGMRTARAAGAARG